MDDLKKIRDKIIKLNLEVEGEIKKYNNRNVEDRQKNLPPKIWSIYVPKFKFLIEDSLNKFGVEATTNVIAEQLYMAAATNYLYQETVKGLHLSIDVTNKAGEHINILGQYLNSYKTAASYSGDKLMKIRADNSKGGKKRAEKDDRTQALNKDRRCRLPCL
jgi:hypothetical protein